MFGILIYCSGNLGVIGKKNKGEKKKKTGTQLIGVHTTHT